MILNELYANLINKQEFVPDVYIDREEQKRTFEEWCKLPLGNLLFTSNQPGTGKTTFIKWASQNILLKSPKFKNANCIYLLCRDTETNYKTLKVFTQLVAEKQKENIKKLDSYEGIKYLEKVFETSGKNWFIVFDEINYLLDKTGNDDFINKILHLQGRLTTKNLIKYCFITNDIHFRDKLSKDAKSRLYDIPVRFYEYSLNEVLNILKYYIQHYNLINKEYLPKNLDKELIKFYQILPSGNMRLLLENFFIWARRCKNVLTSKYLDDTFLEMIMRNETLYYIKKLDTKSQLILYCILKARLDLQKVPDNAKETDYPTKKILYKYYIYITKSFQYIDSKLQDTRFRFYLSRLIKEYGIVDIVRKSRGRGKGMYGVYVLSELYEEYFINILDYLIKELDISYKFTYENNLWKNIKPFL